MASKTVSVMAASKTTFSYDFYGSKPTDLIYQGDAYFPSDTTYLRLTKTDSSGTPELERFGRIIYTEPIQLWKPDAQADFDTTIRFILKPSSGRHTPADGLVFFMVPLDYTFPTETSGGNLGIYGGPDCPSVFAVEFDIFANDEWDPNFPHVGINIESRASQAVTQIPQSFIGKEVELKISYTAATGVISAVASDGKQRVEASYECGLKDVLQQQVQVGLAGSTGEFAAKHDVSHWDFHSALPEN